MYRWCVMSKSEKIKVVLVEPKKQPRVVSIENTLAEKQKLVEGYIECIYPFDDEVALICNEEGKINRLPLNRALYDESGEMCEIIAGNFLITYAPSNSETFLDMPEELAKKYCEKFRFPEFFYRVNGKIKVIKRR